MNCKPGEMAIKTRCGPNADSCDRALVGRAIVKVVTPILEADGWYWKVEQAVPCPLSTSGTCRFAYFSDVSLTPIRGDEGEHPGDKKLAEHEKFVKLPLETLVRVVREDAEEKLKPKPQKENT